MYIDKHTLCEGSGLEADVALRGKRTAEGIIGRKSVECGEKGNFVLVVRSGGVTRTILFPRVGWLASVSMSDRGCAEQNCPCHLTPPDLTTKQ